MPDTIDKNTVRELAKAMFAVDQTPEGDAPAMDQAARREKWMEVKADYTARARKLVRKLERRGTLELTLKPQD